MNLDRYKRPALQFSGGKDSLACLYLLRSQLDRVTVYWLDAGDGCPETREVVEAVRPWIPHFQIIRTDSRGWRGVNGASTDLLPVSAHRIGIAYGTGDWLLSSRYDCCWANLMLPMHERMLADGVDAVIRGTKTCDMGRVPHEGASGAYDVILPIRDWSHEDVHRYLREVGAPVNPIYEYAHGASVPECMSCTAWWGDGKAAYLAARHPEQLAEYRASLAQIRNLVREQLKHLDSELEVRP